MSTGAGAGSAEAGWRQVRSRRADPKGLAQGDPERRRVFGAALQQAEELAAAARAASPASKPITLFYALSQAGRAIVANCEEGDWQFPAAHGLRVERAGIDNVLDFLVQPKANGEFPVVARASGSAPLAGAVTVRELWASLPELKHWKEIIGDARTSLRFGPTTRITAASLFDRLNQQQTIAEFQVFSGSLMSLLDGYPGAAGYEILPLGGDSLARRTYEGVVWPLDASGARRPISDLGEEWGGARWLRPPLGDPGAQTPSLLMTWWALLLALSSAARYAPAQWAAALDPDSSALATVLEELLEVADVRVPQLISGGLLTLRARLMREAVETLVPPTSDSGDAPAS